MSILRQWLKKEDPKPNEKDKGKTLHLMYPFFFQNRHDAVQHVNKIGLRSFPRYYTEAGVLYVDIMPLVDYCIYLPVKETEEELLALFGKKKESHEK